MKIFVHFVKKKIVKIIFYSKNAITFVKLSS